MALPFEVDTLESVPEELQPLYAENNGKFRLQVEGIDPADELKRALAAEREQSKAAKAKLAEAERLREEAERKKLEENKQYEELYNKEKSERERLANEFKASQKESFVDLLISKLTDDQKQAKILKREMLDNVEFSEGKISIIGLPGIGTTEELIAHYREEFPFLFGGSKASGGGANGSGGKPALKQMNRAEFEKLSPAERMKFHRDGGRLTD